MSTGRAHVRFRNLLQLLHAYDGNLPLHLFLQEQFRQHKEWGSSDRRFYREYLYASMRLGQAFPVEKHAERLALTAFLKNDTELFNAWLPNVTDNPAAAAATSAVDLFPDYKAENVFPFSERISKRLDQAALIDHLQQVLPVYARILPKADKGTMVLPPDAELLPGNALRLPPGTDLNEWINDGFLQVQDLGSQQVCQQIEPEPGALCWDMCCGAGGKSLYLAEILHPGNLYCSDLRAGQPLLAFYSCGLQPAVDLRAGFGNACLRIHFVHARRRKRSHWARLLRLDCCRRSLLRFRNLEPQSGKPVLLPFQCPKPGSICHITAKTDTQCLAIPEAGRHPALHYLLGVRR